LYNQFTTNTNDEYDNLADMSGSEKSCPQSLSSHSINELSVTQKYWITKIELELMSSALDQASI